MTWRAAIQKKGEMPRGQTNVMPAFEPPRLDEGLPKAKARMRRCAKRCVSLNNS